MTAADAYPNLIARFESDMTLRWSFRKGDLLFWIRWINPLSSTGGAPRVINFWQMRDGDHVTITNRLPDLPYGFELHPLETKGVLSDLIIQKIRSGYKPGPIVEAPNIWRVKTGDRVVWTGDPRPGQQLPVDSMLAAEDFADCALVFGHSSPHAPARDFYFGAPQTEQLSQSQMLLGKRALGLAYEMGMPRSFSPEWRLG